MPPCEILFLEYEYNQIVKKRKCDFSMIQLQIIGENKTISLQLWKLELGLNSLTKMKRWRNFTQEWLACYRENCGKRVYFIAYSEKKFISQFLLVLISAVIT